MEGWRARCPARPPRRRRATAARGAPRRARSRSSRSIAATLAGGYLALVSFRQDRELSIGGIRLSVSPGHTGSLDVYVPLVDWGARFESIRLPARLRVDVRTVDRDALQRVADGGAFDVAHGPRPRRATRSPPTCAR